MEPQANDNQPNNNPELTDQDPAQPELDQETDKETEDSAPQELEQEADKEIEPITAQRIGTKVLADHDETVDPHKLVDNTEEDELRDVQKVRTLLENGADPSRIARRIGEAELFIKHKELLEVLNEYGLQLDIDDCAREIVLYYDDTKRGIAEALKLGANADRLAEQLSSEELVGSLEILISHGAQINVSLIAYKKLDIDTVCKFYDKLKSCGANIPSLGELRRIQEAGYGYYSLSEYQLIRDSEQ